ncbi:MAG TPA: hypothetical protein VF472_14205 [Burkholderiaceae bacterium]
MNLKRIACVVFLPLCFELAHAAEPAPGEYIAEKGRGTLTVTRGADGKMHFDISAIGANGHSCSIDGGIKEGKAVLADPVTDNPCHVSFKPDVNSIDVVLGNPSECRDYCGARAWFDGRYLVPAPGCRNRERNATEKKFARLYGSKDYQAALNILRPVLNDCAATLSWLEEAQVRNDLAVNLYHLGRKEDCLAVLKPTIDRYGTSESKLREELPPSDFESFLPLASAAWYNVKLCSRR